MASKPPWLLPILANLMRRRLVFDELLQKAIQVDLLVNNAGLMIEGAFKEDQPSRSSAVVAGQRSRADRADPSVY